MVFLFHSWYFMLRYDDFLFKGSILVSRLLRRDILHGNFRLHVRFMKLYGRHTDLVHTFDTSVSHMLKGLFTKCRWHMTGFQLLFRCIATGATCGEGKMLTYSGTHDFTLFGEFMISPIHYIHNIICQSTNYVYGWMVLVCLAGLVWLLCLGLVLYVAQTYVEYYNYCSLRPVIEKSTRECVFVLLGWEL